MMTSGFELQGDFDVDVVEASRSVPVVVDFWAAWCGPCQVLGPVLEELARQAGGRWRLVKVDTERYPGLAQRFGIRGIPTVMLFHDGKQVADFAGALPQPQVQQWLDSHLPRPSDRRFKEAVESIERGNPDGAREILEEIIHNDAGYHAASVLLAQLLLFTEAARAQEIAGRVPEGATESMSAQGIVLLARLLRWAAGETIELLNAATASEDDLRLYRDGARALREGDPAAALEKWIELLPRNRSLDDDGARRACIALFSILGEQNEITQKWRRRFSAALY